MVLIYAFLLGLFLTGFITSLTAVNYFITTSFNASYKCDLILIGAVLLAIVSLLLIKSVTAFFTKNC